MLVKRVERGYRLRMLFVLHLALYAVALVALTLANAGDPMRGTGVLITLWLPLILAHTAAHMLYELRERCTPQAQPAEVFRMTLRQVDLYDEQGNPVTSDAKIDFLPRSR